MPALPAVPKVLKVIVTSHMGDAKDIANILHWQYSGTAPTAAQASTFAESIRSAWATDILTHQDQNYSLDKVTVIDLSSSTSAEGQSTGAPAVGSITTAGLALGSALIVSSQIARRYRGGKPRTYIGGQASVNVTSAGEFGSGYLTTMATQWTSFVNTVDAAGWTGAGTLDQVNVSYFAGFTNHTYPSGRTKAIPTVRGTPLVDVITGFVMRPKIGSQRRRNSFSA